MHEVERSSTARSSGRPSASRGDSGGQRAAVPCRRLVSSAADEASGCPVRDQHVHTSGGQMTPFTSAASRELHRRRALHVVGGADAPAHQHRRFVEFG